MAFPASRISFIFLGRMRCCQHRQRLRVEPVAELLSRCVAVFVLAAPCQRDGLSLGQQTQHAEHL